MKRLRSLRARLIFLYVAIFGATLIAFSYFLFQYSMQTTESEFDSDVRNIAVDVSQSIDFDLFGRLSVSDNLLEEEEKQLPFDFREVLIQVRATTGASLLRSRTLGAKNLPLTRDDIRDLQEKKTLFRTLHAQDLAGAKVRDYRLVTVLVDRPGPVDFVLQVAAPTDRVDKAHKNLLVFFGFSIPIVLILATASGFYLSGRALNPVREIISTAQRITAMQLNERVPVPKTEDEIADLAHALNGLLDRLEKAFLSLESLIGEASHQIKTPLAILRGELDLMGSKPRSPNEMEDFLQTASHEVGYLSRVVEDIILLARMDAGSQMLVLQPLELQEVLLETVVRINKLAEKKQIHITVEAPQSIPFIGDPDLLRSMMEALLENAVKYSSAGRPIATRLEDKGLTVELTIDDNGPGIPADALPKIFDRFFRSSSTRRAVAGAGLGLAIAKKIAELHDGRIAAHNRPEGGARFTVTFMKKS